MKILSTLSSIAQCEGKRIAGFPSSSGSVRSTSPISVGALFLILPPVLFLLTLSIETFDAVRATGTAQGTAVSVVPKEEGRLEIVKVENPASLKVQTLLKRTVRTKVQEKELAQVSSVIVSESKKGGYDPLLIAAIIREESTFKGDAISNVGARGLMQIMPETGEYISYLKNISWEGAHKLHDPQYNLHLGIGYLNHLRRLFRDDMKMVLVAYNWGPGNLITALQEKRPIPASVEKYAHHILETYKKWQEEFGSIA